MRKREVGVNMKLIAQESLRIALNDVEEKLGIKIKKVIASIPSFNAEYSVTHISAKVGDANYSSFLATAPTTPEL